jgi:hypothetical protein
MNTQKMIQSNYCLVNPRLTKNKSGYCQHTNPHLFYVKSNNAGKFFPD